MNYTDIGKTIYGIRRLDSVLTGFTEWMAEHVSPQVNLSGPELRVAVAAAYFEDRKSLSGIKEAYLELLALFDQIEREKTPELLAGRLEVVRHLHHEIPKVFSAVGYDAIPAAFLAAHPNL
ncbi:hypothetical protein GCM10027277_36210 [Pseudoduganella ginsengisoli]|uniref:Uncharacterized protein n=1 Tax=Pseudoduganella ginsengisoli TaxID=1462440 RepID=A0A6L6PXA7_9BURK|nr:hypothetical protein [Pseudoduganella ginsengisoli]MTW02243.1 hypothetical protein [Pseudoduganella ginsengisoli]